MTYNLLYDKYNNRNIDYETPKFNDFNYNQSHYLVACNHNNPIEYDIENYYGYKFLLNGNSNNPIIKYQSFTNIQDSMNLFYSSNHKWNNYTMNFIDYVSGNQINVYGVEPTYLTLSNNIYHYFNFNSIDYKKFGSVLFINKQNYNFISGIKTNNHTNDIEEHSGNIYYGGLTTMNDLRLTSYSIDEKFMYDIAFTVKKAKNILPFTYEICNSGYIHTLYGYGFEYGYNYWSIYRTVYGEPDARPYFVDNSSLNHQSSGQPYSNKSSKMSLNIVKDSLIFMQGSIENPKGSIDLDYCFYTQEKSGLFDYIPKGYVLHPSGGTEQISIPFVYINVPYLVDSSGGYYADAILRPKKIDINSRIVIQTYSGELLPYSSGTIRVYGSSNISDIENMLSALSPYGVLCTGYNIFDMLIYVKGELDSSNLKKAIDFEDFNYRYAFLDLTTKNNKIINPITTHGKLNNSGMLVWSDSHGSELIRFNEYRGTDIENNLYAMPNHLGEIYKVQYNNEKKKVIYTGNLVREIGSVVCDLKGIISGDYIPTGQFISNITNPPIKSNLNKKSFEYRQTVTSNLVCNTNNMINSTYINYTGQYPNFPTNFNLPTYIYTSGMK